MAEPDDAHKINGTPAVQKIIRLPDHHFFFTMQRFRKNEIP